MHGSLVSAEMTREIAVDFHHPQEASYVRQGRMLLADGDRREAATREVEGLGATSPRRLLRKLSCDANAPLERFASPAIL